MFVTELKLDEAVVLKNRATGEILAEVKITSFAQFPTHIAVRLGVTAPQTTKISLPNGNKDLKKDGEKQ